MKMSNFIRTYNESDGLEIEAFIENNKIGELSTISYELKRTMTPIFTVGKIDKIDIVYPKRHISGTLTFKAIKQFVGNAFDVVLTGRNEYGTTAIMKLREIKMLYEGWPVFYQDIIKGNSYNFVAKNIEPWIYTKEVFNKETKDE